MVDQISKFNSVNIYSNFEYSKSKDKSKINSEIIEIIMTLTAFATHAKKNQKN